MIIDAHVHVGSWLHADFLGRENDLAGTLAVFRSAGIDGAALMPSDRHEHVPLREAMKRAVGSGFAGPLWLFPWIRPVAPGSPGTDDLNWVRANRKDVAGLKIHPSLSRVRVSHEPFRAALELAEELSLVVLVHCGRWTEIAGYAHALEAAARHPGAKFLLGHAGGDTPPNAMGAARAVKERGLTNVWFEFSGLREYWVVERNIELCGADRYLMGSDFPLAHPLMYLGAVRGMSLSEEQVRKVTGENALALFGPSIEA
ncbi:MAG: amidohydrolase family protein [Deltaproteobacteria bacterium]|nr:amidohydrolase family protein [Deltaproteobacteria bacterium]